MRGQWHQALTARPRLGRRRFVFGLGFVLRFSGGIQRRGLAPRR